MSELPVRTLVTQYLAGPFRRQAAAPYLVPVLPTALVLVVGGYALGTARSDSDLDAVLD